MLAKGAHANLGFAAGLLVGDLVWLTCGVIGAAALAHMLFAGLKYAGAAYLLYLAVRLWRGEPQAAPAGRPHRGLGWGVWGGLSVALANPKTMMFYLALVPTLLDEPHLDALAFAELCTVIVVVYGGVLTAYIVAASRARRLFASPRTLRLANRGGSVVIAEAAIAVAARA